VELSPNTTTILKSNADTFVAGGAAEESCCVLNALAGLLVSHRDFQQQETAANSETTLNLMGWVKSAKSFFSKKPTTGFSA